MKTNLTSSTITHLLNFEKYSSFQQALKAASVACGFQVVLLSEEFNPLIVIETRKNLTIDEAIKRFKPTAYGITDTFRLIDIEGVKTYWGTIDISGNKYYLLLVDNDDIYSAEEITLLAELIEISMGMWKFTPERDAKAEFVKALVRGNKSLAYSLREEAGIKEKDILSVYSLKNVSEKIQDRIVNEFTKAGLISIIEINEGNDCYGIIFKTEKLKAEKEMSDKQIVADFFNTLKEETGIRVFHVTGFEGIEGAGDGFRLIGETWAFVEKIFPYKRVFTKYELVLVSDCISIQVQGGVLKKNFTDLLEPFRREGDNKAKQLIDTLETFVLDAGMNASKTSEFMNIHTNTVQYRLKKINEVLGVEITANRVIPGLTIALALRRLEK